MNDITPTFRFNHEHRAGWHIFEMHVEHTEPPATSLHVKAVVQLVERVRAECGSEGEKAGPGCFGEDLSRWGVRLAAKITETTTFVMEPDTGLLVNEGERERYVKSWAYKSMFTFMHEADARLFEAVSSEILRLHTP